MTGFGNGFDAPVRNPNAAAEVETCEGRACGPDAVEDCVGDAGQPVQLNGAEQGSLQDQAADAIVCEAASRR